MIILDVNGQTSFFTNLGWMEKGIRQQWRSDLSDRKYEIFIPAFFRQNLNVGKKGKRQTRHQSVDNNHLKDLNNWFLKYVDTKYTEERERNTVT